MEVSGSTSDTTQKIQRATRYGVPGQSAFRPLISSTGWLDWAYNLTNADIQSGTTTVNATANGITEFTVNFPETFAKPPVVIMSVVTSRPDLRSVEPLSRDTQKVTGAVEKGTAGGGGAGGGSAGAKGAGGGGERREMGGLRPRL